MKTIRFIATYISVILCISFTSCSSEEDNPVTNSDVKKRLTKISLTQKNGNDRSEINLSYSDNRISKISITWNNNAPWLINYEYQGNKVTISETNSNFYGDSFSETFTLSDNVIINGEENDKYNYNNGYLLSTSWGAEFIYNKDWNLIKTTDDGFDNITYTDIPNVGNLYIAYRDNDGVYPFYGYGNMFYSGLWGKASKHLPKELKNDDEEGLEYMRFTYEFDEHGYVKVTTIEDYYEDSGKTNTTYWTETYTYETID